jgi:hypothetical protein
MSRQAGQEGACADPQFVLCDMPEQQPEYFESDSVLSIGNPGTIDVEGSDGTHRIVSSGASAHESIILRTRSSRDAIGSDDAPSFDFTTGVEGIDEALSTKYLLKATSSSIKAGLVTEPAPLPCAVAAASDHPDCDAAHADAVLDYLRSFAINEDSAFLPFMHSPSKPLPIDSIRAIMHSAQNLFAEEPRVLTVAEDVRVFSDIHGNFKDLLIWQRLFWPDGAASLQGSVLWLGDYVDRGLNSVEVILYMLAQKVFLISSFLYCLEFVFIFIIADTFYATNCSRLLPLLRSKIPRNGSCCAGITSRAP